MSSDYIPSIIQVDIPSFSEKYVNNQTETFYQINITNTYSNQKWTLEKCFPDFTELENNLSSLISNVPTIEGKSLFKVSAYGELNKRQIYLKEFLKECLIRKDIVSNSYFADFLEISQHAPEILYNAPTKLSEFDGIPMGVKDFFYASKDNMLFVVLSDTNLSSRVDAYITNVNLPWESKSETHISVGAFFAFKVTFDNKKGYKFEKVFAKSFPEQTGCISYDEESMTVIIGLSTGKIVLYRIEKESQFTQYEFLNEYTHHKGNVGGVAADSKTGYVFSCGADHKLISCEMNYVDVPTEVYEGNSGYTRMVLDKKNERLFLTGERGEVDVFLTNSYPPVIVNTIETSSEDYIYDIAVDYKNCYIFTCAENGIINVLDLNTPGKEKHIKEISAFGGDDKYRAIAYDPKTNELVAGDDYGRISIFNLKTGQPIYVLEAHSKAISKLYYDPEERIILTGGEDNFLRGWKLPEKWISDEVRKFEESEVKNMSDTIAMLKLQKSLVKDENYNSDEDSLNGWDYLPDLDETQG